MSKIKKFLRRHSWLMYCICVVKCFFSKTDRKKVVDLIYGNSCFYINHYGNKNSGEIIYYIVMDSTSGFGVLYKNLLRYLYVADTYGFLPYIEFSDNVRYANNDCLNAYENFFQQPAGLSHDAVMMSENVIYSKPQDLSLLSSQCGYDIEKTTISSLSVIHKKMLSVSELAKVKIADSALPQNKGIRVLGVHVRGTDFKKNFKNHPVYIPPEVYLQKAKEEMIRSKYDKVFLATDEQAIEEMFSQEFGDDLILNNCYRSKDDTAIHYAQYMDADEKTVIGYDVLLDIYSLAMCSSLIGGKSNVSVMAQVVNKAFFDEYEYCEILDYGINKKGKRLRR